MGGNQEKKKEGISHSLKMQTTCTSRYGEEETKKGRLIDHSTQRREKQKEIPEKEKGAKQFSDQIARKAVFLWCKEHAGCCAGGYIENIRPREKKRKVRKE